MAPERWQQIEKLLQAALESAPSERSAFLDEACAGDQALRNEVESLIPLREQTIGQLETSSLEMAADLPGDRPNESGLGGSRLAPLPTASDQQGPLSPEKVVQDPAIVDGKYLLECRLGQGGMGSVYRARHLELGKWFALKLIQPYKSHRPEYLTRFRNEAKALGRLNHPNIVQVTDFGIDSRGVPYLVMEYIKGITLRDYVTQKGPLSPDEALPIFSSIARALDYAHDSGIIHRDLKPSNVFLAQRESNSYDVKILDFGIARFQNNRDVPETISEPNAESELHLTQSARADLADTVTTDRRLPQAQAHSEQAYTAFTDPGTLVGTPEYIAPEVFRGQQSSFSIDIYAFGILIYEVLVGQRPFQGSVSKLLNLHAHSVPPMPSAVRSSLPKELNQAILRPLNKNPVLRPAHAHEVVGELHDAYYKAQVRQWRQRELPKRAAVSVAIAVLALILYPFSGRLPAIQALENKLFDTRIQLLPIRSPDPRIVLASIDEATLSADPGPLPEKADEVGILLERVFNAGARVVAVDLLLPEQWSRSQSFSRLILNHSKNMVLASYSRPGGGVNGPECVKGLVTVALGPEKVEKLFGFVNLQEDPDGVVRRMPLIYQDQQGKSVYSLAARAAEIFTSRSPVEALSATRLYVDYSINWTEFRRISWKDVPYLLAKEPQVFRDRVILVGGEFAGSGDVFSPSASTQPGAVSGLVLQALTVNMLLESRKIEKVDETLVAAFLGVAITVAVMALLSLPNSGWTAGILALSCVLYIVFSHLLFRWSPWLLPIVAPTVAFCLAVLCALLLRRKLPTFPKTAIVENEI